MPENTTRIVGTFKCPNGHVFETVQTPIMATTCQEPECGAAAHRQATHFEPSPLVSTSLVRLALARGAEWLQGGGPADQQHAIIKELHGMLAQVYAVAEGVKLEPKPFDPDAHEIHALVNDAKIKIFIDKVPVFQCDYTTGIETPPTPADKLAKLRATGWSVVCHNDYRQSGKRMTFWSFAKRHYYIKGEGATDDEALAVCMTAVDELGLST